MNPDGSIVDVGAERMIRMKTQYRLIIEANRQKQSGGKRGKYPFKADSGKKGEQPVSRTPCRPCLLWFA